LQAMASKRRVVVLRGPVGELADITSTVSVLDDDVDGAASARHGE
jgi:hypothetical protein